MTNNHARNIVPLGISAFPAIQTEILQQLCEEMGLENGMDVIERAAFELSDRLWILNAAFIEGNFDEVRRVATSLVAIGRQIGLTEFSDAAQSLASCAQRSDIHALHAVHSRLQRVGEKSLYYAVQFQDYSS